MKMFSIIKNRNIMKFVTNFSRNYSEKNNMKVAVIGAAGNIGQPLSLMLKQSPHIEELAMYDINNVNSIGTELAFMDTKCRVTSAKGNDCAKFALKDAKVVAIVAAAPKSNVMSLNAMFDANAKLMKDIAQICSEYCPKAYFAIATNPVNSMVPIFSEILKKNGVYNPKAVFGVTTLNVVRANTFVAEVLGLEPECVVVPVVGGNSEKTIVPLLSHAKPIAEFTMNELEMLTVNIQKAHANIIKERQNKCPALSSSFAIARFVIAIIKGLLGHKNIIECAFVKTLQYENTKYFASPVELGISGLQRNLGVPTVLTDYEQCLVDEAIPLVAQDVKKGETFLGVIEPLEPCDICIPEPRSPKCPVDWCEKKRNRTLYD